MPARRLSRWNTMALSSRWRASLLSFSLAPPTGGATTIGGVVTRISTSRSGRGPDYLVDRMSDGPLQRKLEQCSEGPFYKSDFSIGHRGGGPLQIPEHTRESHEAGARMGAGIQECDVTFTATANSSAVTTSAICTRRPTSF